MPNYPQSPCQCTAECQTPVTAGARVSILILVAAAWLCVASSAQAQTCPIGASVCGPRNIVNSYSGKCLNVLDYGQHNGANVVQATACTLDSSHWYINLSVTDYEFRALHSGQCLNVLNASQSNGANVVQAQNCWIANSQWNIVHIGWKDGRKLYNIRAAHSNQCLNVLDWGTHNGANVVQAQNCSLATSKWFID